MRFRIGTHAPRLAGAILFALVLAAIPRPTRAQIVGET